MKAKDILEKAAVVINNALVVELKEQGHYLTGALEKSITRPNYVIVKSKGAEISGYALDYAQDLETGQSANGKLPSVAELFKYFKLRGLSDTEATRAAILTQRKQAKEGIPTKASSRFSKTGERKHFIERAWKSNEQKVDSLIGAGMDSMFNDEYKLQKSETI